MDENWATDSIDIYIKFIQILKIAGNQFEFFWGDKVMIGCSAESTNQKSPKFKKVCHEEEKDDLASYSKIISNF